MQKIANWISGEEADPIEGTWLELINPSTGVEIARVAASGVMDVVRAVQAANKAWTSWRKSEIESRARILETIAERLSAQARDLAMSEARETGTPFRFTLASLQTRTVETFRAAARSMCAATSLASVANDAVYISHRMPIGVVAVITPAPDGLFALGSRVAAALSAGNAIIAKPSSRAAGTALLFAKIIHDAGLPAGVFNLVQGRGAEAGSALVNHPGLSTLSFAGRTETARVISRDAAEFIKRVQFSSSGCNPVLVFAETDLEKTAERVVALTLTSEAPLPLRGARVFIQDSVYERFLALYKTESEKIKIGSPENEQTLLGPLGRSDQARFDQAISQAQKEKGKLLFGGTGAQDGAQTAELDPNGSWVRPSAFYDLTLCSTLQQEEVIGPFALLSSFKYQHEAIKHANNSPFGQAAYVFHENASKASRIALQLEAGRVFVNPMRQLWDARMSYGGLKLSGLGREGGDETLRFFSREVLIASDISV